MPNDLEDWMKWDRGLVAARMVRLGTAIGLARGAKASNMGTE